MPQWMLRSLLHRVALLLLLVTWQPSCSLLNPTPHLNNAQLLMQRPDFTNAVTAAPEWVRSALHTINALEHQLERGN